MVRKFKKAIILVKLFIATLIVYIKDESFRFWFEQTIDDVYYLRKIRTEKGGSAVINKWIVNVNVNTDLDRIRSIAQTSGFKCLEEATKDVIWRYDIFTNKVKAIKVK